MTSLTGRWSRALQRTAAVSFASALVAVSISGVAQAESTDPSVTPSAPPTSADPDIATDPPGGASESAASDDDAAPFSDGQTPVDPGEADRAMKVKAPGKITCEDLGLGTTLQKVNGARKNKVMHDDGVSSVVVDTDVDDDGDPDSMFVLVEPGTTVTAVVAMHGNRANIYDRTFEAGVHGPFYAPPRKNNEQPPVNHRLICGPASSPSSSAPSTTPPSSPSTTPPSSPPSSPAAPGGGGGLPVTGLALTGVILTGLGLVGAGVAMRAIRRRGDDEESGEESTDI